MVSPQRPHAYFSPEEYLELERHTSIKYEYLQGQVVAMAEASKSHIIITGNLSALLVHHLRGKGCLSFASDMKVRISKRNAFYYPDVVVSCDDRDRGADDTVLRYPQLIIEVLAPSTEAFDRGEKFLHYQTIETLQEYVLVHQAEPIVEVFARATTNLWTPSVYRQGDRLKLESIGLACGVEELYAGLELLGE